MSPLIEIQNLYFSYEDGTPALRDINLSIPKGRKIAVIGSNGSGKSSLFLCLNGILKPSCGKILLDGKPIHYSQKGLCALRRNVGIVFQEPDHQLFCTSIYQEISFGVLNLGVSATQAEQAVQDVIHQLDITPFVHKPIHALSGGQKKQVSIADILVMKPRLILLDEPTASLDHHHTTLVRKLIDDLSVEHISVIISTHDVDYACSWADEIILLHQGQVIAHRSPADVFCDQALLSRVQIDAPSCFTLFDILIEKGLLPQHCQRPCCMAELEHCLRQHHS